MNLASLDPLELTSFRPAASGLNHGARPLGQPAIGHKKARGVANSFDTASPDGFLDGFSLAEGISQAGDLERLLFGILARFMNSPAEEAERETEDALKRICQALGVEQAALWRNSAQHPEQPATFLLTQHCVLPSLSEADPGAGNPTIPLGAQSKACRHWITPAVKRGETVFFSRIEDLPVEAAHDKAELSWLGIRSGVFIPICVAGEVLGAVSFGMITEDTLWPEQLVRPLEYVAAVFAQAIARQRSDEALTRAYAEIKELTDRLGTEANHLTAETKISYAQGGIIGRSQQIRQVLHKVEQVAPANCPVLISGETGTGKELIAGQIHRLSARKERPMVLVNCAALPTALVESELFGRERGAYTGALTSQVGRFEVANASTVFLDEVGELPIEVQAKLLRVLQQGEFQRLGSPKTHQVDVRVIAATNRDLAEAVRKGRFREDLYYRLKVFPIDIPPLRKRVEDIPLLVFAFMEEFAKRMGKKITKIPRKAMELLQAHSWPGNIRELRNVIEHSVILTAGDTLKLTILSEPLMRKAQPTTLEEVEREHILKTLESTSWRIKGPHGAAARLGLEPSTLYSRMQKLGIPNRREKDEMSGLG
jgi:formate hydrogenlyase transcriptional activator